MSDLNWNPPSLGVGSVKYLLLFLLTSCATPYAVVQQRSPALEYLIDDVADYRGVPRSLEIDRQPQFRYYEGEFQNYNGTVIYFNNGGY